MNLIPLGDRVVVEPFEVESMTAGGIIIPDNAKEKPKRGKVIAAAKDLTVTAGDNVLYDQYAGSEYKEGDKSYLIMREFNIVAIITIGNEKN